MGPFQFKSTTHLYSPRYLTGPGKTNFIKTSVCDNGENAEALLISFVIFEHFNAVYSGCFLEVECCTELSRKWAKSLPFFLNDAFLEDNAPESIGYLRRKMEEGLCLVLITQLKISSLSDHRAASRASDSLLAACLLETSLTAYESN